jgi:DNA uptake protein ComE-like DNA-binding protein
MSTNNRGILWKLLNSLWVLWAFVPMFNWVGFFHIGRKAKYRRWIIFGFIYLVLTLVLPMISVSITSTTISNVILSIACISWLCSIGHSFISLGKYLKKRSAILDSQDSQEVDFIPPNYTSKTQYYNYTPPHPQPKAFTSPIVNQQPTHNTINLNTCSEKQLANLPGVSVALSKKAIKIRTEIGGFTSVNDFNSRLGLKPHFAVQIKNLAYATPAKQTKSTPRKRGRVVDI